MYAELHFVQPTIHLQFSLSFELSLEFLKCYIDLFQAMNVICVFCQGTLLIVV